MVPDPARYPRLAAYLALLPDGIDSYPACQVHGEMARLQQRRYTQLWNDPELPPAVQKALTRPIAERGWVNAAVSVSQAFVVCDRLVDEAEYLERATRATLAFLRSPMQRAITQLLSPTLLVLGASWRWQKFVSGTQLSSRGGDRHSHVLHLRAPAHLFPVTSLKFFAVTFTALLQTARAHDVQVEVEAPSPTEGLFKLRWRT